MAESDTTPAEQGGSGGRDPETGRFLPGVSGNPNGRPRGYDFHTLLLDGLKAKGETVETVFGEVVTGLRGAVKVPSTAPAAAKVLLDRICGPVVAAPAHSGEFEPSDEAFA